MNKTPSSAGELIPQKIKRLTELCEKHRVNISDDHANMIYWQIEGLCNNVLEAAGIHYGGPALAGTYTIENKLADDLALEDSMRVRGRKGG